jgi:hypothetical protein
MARVRCIRFKQRVWLSRLAANIGLIHFADRGRAPQAAFLRGDLEVLELPKGVPPVD